MKNATEMYKQFRMSLNFRAPYLYVLFLDLCFYLLAIASAALWRIGLNKWAERLGGVDLSNLANLQPAEIEAIRNTLSSFWASFIGYTILLAVFLLLIYSIFKGYIWKVILKRKTTKKYLLKFALLNLIWIIFLALVITSISFFTRSIEAIELSPFMPALALLSMFAKHPYFTAVFTLLIAHTTTLIQVFFAMNASFEAVKKAFSSYKKFHHFLLYYLFAAIPLLAIYIISLLLQFLPYAVNISISLLLIIAFITWLRFYVVRMVEILSV